jgi:hypothetical protein
MSAAKDKPDIARPSGISGTEFCSYPTHLKGQGDSIPASTHITSTCIATGAIIRMRTMIHVLCDDDVSATDDA